MWVTEKVKITPVLRRKNVQESELEVDHRKMHSTSRQSQQTKHSTAFRTGRMKLL